MVIYKTTNLVNGKFYVGKDEKNSPEYLGSGIVLKTAIKKYGTENFKKEILEECTDKKELNEREKYWIATLSATTLGYNIALGGEGGDTYSKNPKLGEIKKKLSGNRNHFFNKTHSDESKAKMSKSQSGRKAWNKGLTNIHSDETKAKMSIARTLLTGESATNFVKIEKEVLVNLLKNHSINKTAKILEISVSCVRRKINDFQLSYQDIKKQRLNVIKSSLYYTISDDLFNEILNTRIQNKASIEELSKIFQIGVNKLRQEFKKREVKIKRIK